MYRITCIILAFSISFAVKAQFLDKKEDLKKYEGYFNFHYNEQEDGIYLEVDMLNTEFLYTHFLNSGGNWLKRSLIRKWIICPTG